MRRLLLAVLPLCMAAESGAQVIRRGSVGAPPPAAWVSGTAALTQGWTVIDGSTSSRWEFGNATLYGASLEKALTGLSIGVRGATGLVPLHYSGSTTTPSGPVAVSTDADARVSQLLASVHVAGGQGFHSVVELDAGATYYSSFRSRTPGVAPLGPSGDADFTFAFGYGVGYGFSNRFAVEVVQDVTMLLHQRTGLGAGEDSNTRMHSTRFVGRLGLGQKP